jgi:hypothetical protein
MCNRDFSRTEQHSYHSIPVLSRLGAITQNRPREASATALQLLKKNMEHWRIRVLSLMSSECAFYNPRESK